MSESFGVNLSAIQRQEAKQEAAELIAEQLESQETALEDLERAFNPQAADREQARKGRARNLETRRKVPIPQPGKIQEVNKKSEEDLANSFHQRNRELPANALIALKNAIREEQSAEEILEQTEKFFSDPTLAEEALEFLEQTTQGELQAKVIRARQILIDLKGREVIAGKNIDAAAKSFDAQGLATAQELRELYREVTGDPKEHNALFIELSGRYTFDDLKQVVSFLLQGMAYDLKSKGPSIQQAELQLLMRELKNLQSILWVYLFFKSRKKLLRSLYDKYGLDYDEEELDFEKLSKNFIQIVEDRYPSVMKILRQAEKMGLDYDEEKVIVLSQFRDAIRQLSPRLYKSMKHKQDLITAMLETLEELEDKLEAEEEEE